MKRHQVRRIVVLDDRSKVIGVVTDGDLARAGRCHPELEHQLTELVEPVSDRSTQAPVRSRATLPSTLRAEPGPVMTGFHPCLDRPDDSELP